MPAGQLNVSDIIYEHAHANTGIANIHVPMTPIAKSIYEAFPTKGLKAAATSCTVFIFVIPCLNNTTHAVRIIKYITNAEIVIPKSTSWFIS